MGSIEKESGGQRDVFPCVSACVSVCPPVSTWGNVSLCMGSIEVWVALRYGSHTHSLSLSL